MRPLLVKETPKPNESLYSLFYRLAIANYADHLGSMLRHIERDIYSTNCNYLDENLVRTPALLEFAKKADIEPFQYTLNKYNHLLVNSLQISSPKAADFQSHRVYQKYATKYCPVCIKEDYYHRLDWDISLVTMCKNHQVKLIDCCPNCNKKILLNRFMRDECKCGFHFSQTKDIDLEENHLVIQAQKTIHQYLNGGLSQEFNGIDFQAEDYFFLFFKFCCLFDLKEAKKFPSFSGISPTRKINFLKRSSVKRNIEMMRFITALAHFTTIEPDKYLPEVLSVFHKTKNKSKDSYHADYLHLKTILNHKIGYLYQNVYDTYLLESTDVYINKNTLFKGNKKNKKYITRLEALKLLKTEWTTLQNLCIFGLLKLHKSDVGDKKIYLIEKESVTDYLKMKKECLNISKLMNFLGVTFHMATGILEKELILALHGPKIDGYPLWYIKREEAERFFQNLIALSKKELLEVNSNWVDLKKANMNLRPFEIDSATLIELLLNEELPFATLKNPKSLNDIYINDKVLGCFIRKKKLDIIETHGFKIKELQKVFKVGEPKIKRWIDEGKIRITSKRKSWTGCESKYISVEETKKVLMEIKGWDYIIVDEYINVILCNDYY
ncbi:hypothetical protein E2K98_12965 [Bacillus salipaludis]|uniref:TniQ domain-containing protein n=1 Tax=Bacillus salipaludis TaxID=2547811 RepID=A0A4R5VUN4_9BACI|nr:TniQ family protein [Bacillus salipaludis]TDK61792.1 hypothetical protein E2K98_12965 [Bacillus salipaludis]